MCDDAALFHKDINTILDKLGFSEGSEGWERPALRSRDIIDIIDGYKGHGNYGPSTDEELGINYWVALFGGDVFLTQTVIILCSYAGGNFLSDWRHS